jgi:predicted ABC-type ATPase
MVPPAQQPFSPPRHNTPPRWFHLLAGPNGAGKSTLYRALVREGILGPPLEFVNADLYEQAHLQHIADPEARSEAAR